MANLPAKNAMVQYQHMTPADRLQTMFALFNHFQLQSNVIVAASYASTESVSLTKPRVYHVLRKVIDKHPQLAMTYFRRPSQKDKDKHRCWKGYLNEINLDNCVSFVEDIILDDEGLCPMIEQLHQVWFNQNSLLEHGQALWKLVVVNGQHAIFVYDHAVGDGRSGLMFHESLMDALNSESSADDADQGATLKDTSVVRVQIDKPYPDPLDLVIHRMSIFYVLYMVLLFHLIRLIFRGESLLFSDAKMPKHSFDYKNPADTIDPPITRLQCLRINENTIETALMLCKKHKITFTAFLYCLAKIGLTADLYPLAQISFGSIATDLRARDITLKEFTSTIGNTATGLWHVTWTSDSKKAAQGENCAEAEDKYRLNIPCFWSMATKFMEEMSHELKNKKRYLDDYKAFASIGADDEDYTTSLLPGLSLRQRNAWSLSNLGVFHTGQSDTGTRRWSISNVEFSAGITKAGVGPNITLNVVSTAQGGCVIYAAFERESLREENVKTLLEGIEKRMYLIEKSAV